VVSVPLVVREGLQGGMRIGLLYTFRLSSQKFIHRYVFTYRVLSINSWIFVYLPCFLKIAIIISHRHYPHVTFVLIPFSQTLNRMTFGWLSFPGARWYVVTIGSHKWYVMKKSLRTTALKQSIYMKCQCKTVSLLKWMYC